MSTGFLSGNAFAYACTTSIALSPKPAPKPARCFRRSATSGSVMFMSDESVQAGDCSFSVEQMIIGTPAAVGAASGTYGCCGRTLPSTLGLKPKRMPPPAPPPADISAASFCWAFVAIS